LPVAGEVTDDYGIERVWFEYQIDQANPRTAAFLATPGGNQTLSIESDRAEVLDLKELQEVAGIAAAGADKENGASTEPKTDGSAENGDEPKNAEETGANPQDAKSSFHLKEGQRFSLVVKAQDQSTLEGGPFVGSSEKYQLDVVSPDRLLAILEARELTLRQRFETIIEEFTKTRDLLVRIDFGGGRGAVDEKGVAPEHSAGKDPADDQATPVDAADPKSPAEQRESRLRDIDRVLENSERAAHETRTVGMAFHEILEEMANNRIDTPALSGRLRDEIADPLVALADRRLSVLTARLKELQKLVNDASRGSAKVEEAAREADAILLEMQNILDKMIEMATYKELVEKLRKVIEQQEKLNEETKRQQVERLKSLIEE
jgi:hypothetical protein